MSCSKLSRNQSSFSILTRLGCAQTRLTDFSRLRTPADIEFANIGAVKTILSEVRLVFPIKFLSAHMKQAKVAAARPDECVGSIFQLNMQRSSFQVLALFLSSEVTQLFITGSSHCTGAADYQAPD